MLRNFRKIPVRNCLISAYIQKRTFLTNDYKCTEAWNAQRSSPIVEKINLNDFYNVLDQTHTSKGVISAIDVDIFANAVKDPAYLEELKDLLHRLRLSAETGSTLESTHQATVRSYIEYGDIEELINILKDPLNFGVFLDDYTANILLDKLVSSNNYDLAANVASMIMLQEEFSNEITNALSQYACYKFITSYKPPEPEPPKPQEKKKKVEEFKIRIKFLRNPYFDDHFDITDPLILSGKTLAWVSERGADNLNNNLQIIGWLMYKKYDKLVALCEEFSKLTSSKMYAEVMDILQKECSNVGEEEKAVLDKCISILSKISPADVALEESLKNTIENAINKSQNKDITQQQKLFKSWSKLREEKLEEQTKRLDRVKRMQFVEEKQKELEKQEQKLWFFDNEESIDLQIEEKEKLVDKTPPKKSISQKVDENYIPPEILPKRR